MTQSGLPTLNFGQNDVAFSKARQQCGVMLFIPLSSFLSMF
ncbi:hypothetical protein AmDm5_2246 [Acetobacter malorum]|nr:hypothetical protein AmDm5_2246 [Acetobacter malorum]